MNDFNIKLGNKYFQQRQSQLLEHLKNLEGLNTGKFNNDNEMDVDTNNSLNILSNNKLQQRKEVLRFKGKQSIFKKPDASSFRNYIKKLPDYKKNPHKWTKYSLEDVEEVTNESNRKSALNFLNELASRKREVQSNQEQNKSEKLPSKIFFNKHVKENLTKEEVKSSEEEQINAKITFNGSTIIMPEYNIGQKTAKPVKAAKNAKKEKELKLDHLFCDDEPE